MKQKLSLNVSDVWKIMKRKTPINLNEVPISSGTFYPKEFREKTGKTSWQQLSDQYGIDKFGFSIDIIPPGAMSSLRHWHNLEDEFVFVIEGELVLVTNDGEFLMKENDMMGFKAGDKNAHHLINKSNKPARFIVVGARVPGDMGFYPDDDLLWVYTEEGKIASHKDGRKY
jgi:uncharacterized cupin superfamily protein